MPISIVDTLNTYLASVISLYSTINQNSFSGDTAEELMSRTDPSNSAVSSYMDGSRIRQLNISYYAKSASQQTASNQLDLIISALDLNCQLEISSGTFIFCESVTLPVYVSRDDFGNYIFTCSFKLQYHTT